MGRRERGRKDKRGEKGKVKGKEWRRGGRRDLAHPKISAWRPLWRDSESHGEIYPRRTQQNLESGHFLGTRIVINVICAIFHTF